MQDDLVLVTGATGFIGKHAIDILRDRNVNTIALFNNTKPELEDAKSSICWLRCDITNQKQLANLISTNNPTKLIHLAWYVNPVDYWTSIKNYDFLMASMNLLRLFEQNGGKRVIFAGTAAEFHGTRTEYTNCKRILRELMLAYCKSTNIHGSWGSINYVFGPGDYTSKLVPQIIKTAMDGKLLELKYPKQFTNYLYVRDVARKFVELLDSIENIYTDIKSKNDIRLGDLVNYIGYRMNVPGSLDKQMELSPIFGVPSVKETNFEHAIDETIKFYQKEFQNV